MPVPFDEENPTLQPAEKQSVSREKPLTRWEVPVMVKLPTDHANILASLHFDMILSS